jgi:starch synthase
LQACIERALAVYADKPVWRQIQHNGMRRDFSWNRSAEEYLALYEAVLESA